MEVDEAGRLAAFRERFGRGWDAKKGDSEAVAREEGEELSEDVGAQEQYEGEGDLMDLLSEHATQTGLKSEPFVEKGKGGGKGGKKKK